MTKTDFSPQELTIMKNCLRNEAASLRKFAEQTNPSDARPAEIDGFRQLSAKIFAIAQKCENKIPADWTPTQNTPT